MFSAIPETPQHAIKNRPLTEFNTDAAAVRAIAQAAISVELFTIPLYMNSMYSIYGTHQINSRDHNYYKGRQWPGMSTSANPQTANEHAFNIIFSVFIQEMLHLQMAANLATAIGVKPSFTTGSGLQDSDNGWICYGPAETKIPCIVKLTDTKSYSDVKVNLEALNHNQIQLFLAIEQPENVAREELRDNAHKYFPDVPLADWTPQKGFADLPLFGTIGYMYECYAKYISMEYEDGKTLWQKLFDNGSVQQDMFNVHSTPTEKNESHPEKEFPCFSTLFEPAEKDGGGIVSQNKAIDMMCAITDQGEGNSTGIAQYRRTHLLKAVQPDYRESKDALKADYPSYDGDGEEADSKDTAARFNSAAFDHYERFHQVKEFLESKSEIASKRLSTWEEWHAAGNRWTSDMLLNKDYDPSTAPKNIPSPEAVANAINSLKDGCADTLKTLSQVSAGAIYGITSVLDDYWTNSKLAFPYPSMVGSGDRMSICWAITGCSPQLSVKVPLPDKTSLYHACQGLDLNKTSDADLQCAAIAVYHTCRGSNGCKSQGGCGFAQLDSGGGASCRASYHKSVHAHAPTADNANQVLCGTKELFSAPSDNKCKSFGGCAVPISASQLFPARGSMVLYNFAGAPDYTETRLPDADNIGFQLGDNVFDIAWAAYVKVMEVRQQDPGTQPQPTDLRLALPPST
ncbi:ferritin-like domain-containing protein [Undibacterium sp. Ji50W]|uniref:ferritin-like domain-containing protein n=1 Tax=Undibacterium sp. Ji50W TaxID=3413041 RepID=UPI003BF3B795